MDSYAKVNEAILLPNSKYIEPQLPDFEIETLEMFKNIPPAFGKELRELLFPKLKDHYLAHGSYGACSEPILQLCNTYRSLIEVDPVAFHYEKLYPLLIRSLRYLAKFVRTSAPNIFLVLNVEFGIQTVLSSLKLQGAKDVVCFSFNYEAVLYAAEHYCKSIGGNLLKVKQRFTLD
jgi:isopenicillin-N epimerase